MRDPKASPLLAPRGPAVCRGNRDHLGTDGRDREAPLELRGHRGRLRCLAQPCRFPGSPGPPGSPDSPDPLGTQTRSDALLRETYRTAEGSVAYVSDRSELYVRVREGWRKVQLGELIAIPADGPSSAFTQDSGRPGERIGPRIRSQELQEPPGYSILPNTYHSAPGLHLVALNTPLSGDMRGIRGADFQCYQQARAMGLLSTYRAFLSSHLQDLATVVKKGERFSLPIVNLKGEVLFINWMAIFSGDGGAFEPRVPIYSFDGRNVMTDPSWPQKMVWHGSSAAGIRTTSGYCEAWRAGDAAVTGQASALQSGRLLGQHTRGCSNRFVVLCVENSYVAEPRRT
ncbi:hypothetical protein Z043_121207 [Scleropages formosus]|uniref:Collagen alpha-1(XV) chain-like n=1 Tax=Scleropages formosus TaxID=113540 RepID=A0A0P7Y532_SCLFO|nr:hypothetical protein Z043_121207 [Scleropages formosus]